MKLDEMIESAAEKTRSKKDLATTLGISQSHLADAKAGRRGLPNHACGKLGDILGIDRWAVVCASELATEKSEERRAYFVPFVQHAGSMLMTIVLSVVTLFVTPAEKAIANQSVETPSKYVIYIMRHIGTFN